MLAQNVLTKEKRFEIFWHINYCRLLCPSRISSQTCQSRSSMTCTRYIWPCIIRLFWPSIIRFFWPSIKEHLTIKVNKFFEIMENFSGGAMCGALRNALLFPALQVKPHCPWKTLLIYHQPENSIMCKASPWVNAPWMRAGNFCLAPRRQQFPSNFLSLHCEIASTHNFQLFSQQTKSLILTHF